MNPKLSVLLPCYNAARYLPSCLHSLSAQSFKDFEILAVDDGSEDETPEVIRKAVAKDSRIRLLRQPHRGIASALRRAAEGAEAGLLARMDADDRCHPHRFLLQVRFMREHPEVDVVGSRIQMFPREQLTDGLLRYEWWVNGLLTHEAILRDLFVESPLPHPSVVMRRASLERAGGYRDMDWPEDYDLWMRMARLGLRFAKLPQVLLEWRDGPERASRTDGRFTPERFLHLKEHYLLRSFLARRRRIIIWGAGPVGKTWARRLRRRGLELPYLVDVDPRKIGQRIHGALVVDAREASRWDGAFVLVAVGALSREPASTSSGSNSWRAAREEIRERLAAVGLVDGRDFVCVA